MRLDPGDLSADDLRRRFDRAADTFEDADYVHRATFDGLLERLEPVSLDVAVVVDLGSATGRGSAALARKFRKARVIGLDVSERMLRRCAARRSFLSRVREVQADACHLPFDDNSIDLVFANLLLPWIGEPDRAFGEINRVLRKDGVFAFASFGPDTMSEFRENTAIHRFPDMHDVGDGLVRAGLRDPVLDVDRLRVTWGSFDELLADLVSCGAISGDVEMIRAGEAGFKGRDETGRPGIELELVYGHAWGSGPRPPAGEFRVEPGAIGRRERQ